VRYDAVAFLKALHAPAPRVPGPTLDDIPDDWRDFYRERVSIMVVSGGLPREQAEHFALLDTLDVMRNWDKYPTY